MGNFANEETWELNKSVIFYLQLNQLEPPTERSCVAFLFLRQLHLKTKGKERGMSVGSCPLSEKRGNFSSLDTVLGLFDPFFQSYSGSIGAWH